MPRKSAIEKKRKEVLEVLAKRDTSGQIKCSFSTCKQGQNLIIHHRYKLALQRGDQYKRLQLCLKNPDNCEILCKYHARKSDMILLKLSEGDLLFDRLEGETNEECIKRIVLRERNRMEYEESHYEEYEVL